eukprot:scpid90336/ scgid34180/ GPI inositol-deacylase; Post-GPI attachment to proteins factor 1
MNGKVEVLIALPLVVILVLGLFKNFHPAGENQCQMTYMFEGPEYLRIKLDASVEAVYPDYGLYIYGEGQQASLIRSSKFRMSGVPVLFLPGNAGSYQQVRSLASVALRMSLTKPGANHLDWFTIDFNEEMGGIHGSTLMSQSNFASVCVEHILSLYNHLSVSARPSSVVIVGHSMGGVVARSLLTTDLLPSHSIHTILTLASPHQTPALALDNQLNQFYTTVNQIWSERTKSGNLSDVVLVSLAGGLRDELIPAVHTPLTGVASCWQCLHQ